MIKKIVGVVVLGCMLASNVMAAAPVKKHEKFEKPTPRIEMFFEENSVLSINNELKGKYKAHGMVTIDVSSSIIRIQRLRPMYKLLNKLGANGLDIGKIVNGVLLKRKSKETFDVMTIDISKAIMTQEVFFLVLEFYDQMHLDGFEVKIIKKDNQILEDKQAMKQYLLEKIKRMTVGD